MTELWLGVFMSLFLGALGSALIGVGITQLFFDNGLLEPWVEE